MPEPADIELIAQGPEVDARLRTSIEYVNDNLAGKLTRKEIARQVGLRESYIGEYFKACSGVRLTDYIRMARLAKARDLLRSGFRTSRRFPLPSVLRTNRTLTGRSSACSACLPWLFGGASGEDEAHRRAKGAGYFGGTISAV